MRTPRISIMKTSILTAVPALLLFTGAICRAQEDIKVTITKNKDQTYSTMKTDVDNHSAEETKCDASGRVIETTVFVLDDTGKALGGFIYDPKGDKPKGILRQKTRYKWDESNRVSDIYYFSVSDKLLSHEVYRYGADGGVTKIDTYDPAGNLISSTSAAGGDTIPRARQVGH